MWAGTRNWCSTSFKSTVGTRSPYLRTAARHVLTDVSKRYFAMSCMYLPYLSLTLIEPFTHLAFHSGIHSHAFLVYSSFRSANPYDRNLDRVSSLVFSLIEIRDERMLASPSRHLMNLFACLRSFPNNTPLWHAGFGPSFLLNFLHYLCLRQTFFPVPGIVLVHAPAITFFTRVVSDTLPYTYIPFIPFSRCLIDLFTNIFFHSAAYHMFLP